MRFTQTPTGMLLFILMVAALPRPSYAWSLKALNPFCKKELPAQSPRQTPSRPGPLEQLNTNTKEFFSKANADTKEFFSRANADTKAFFSNATRTLTFQKTAPGKSPVKQLIPWGRQPQSRRQPVEKKPGWFGSFFHREEPKPPQSLDEWLSLKRPDP